MMFSKKRGQIYSINLLLPNFRRNFFIICCIFFKYVGNLNDLGGILKGFVGYCNTEILKTYAKVKILIIKKRKMDFIRIELPDGSPD